MKLTIAAAVLVAFSAAPATAALPTAERAAQSAQMAPVPTTATVPVDLLGSNATVAVVTKGSMEMLNAKGLGRSLEVISADGTRHPVWTVALRETPTHWFPGDFVLADWRPEMHSALLRVSLGGQGEKAVSYDVTTGATRELKLPQDVNSIGLDPDGTGLLMTTYPGAERSRRVSTLSWAGVKSSLPARADAVPLISVDGHTLVTSDSVEREWWVTDLATRTSVAFPTKGSCTPTRWYDATSVIATCNTPRGSQIRQIDLDGTSSALGIRHSGKTRAVGPLVFNDDDLRVVQGTTWYESFGGCGGAFLTRQTAAGSVKLVRVPGRLTGTLSLVGARGDDLVIAHEKHDCGTTTTRAALSLFDPVTKTESVLTELRRDEAWRDVRTATEVRAWAY